MALTTTTTSWPWRRVRATWSATARTRSASLTDVPPNFCTTSATGRRYRPADPPSAEVRPRGEVGAGVAGG